MDFDIGTSVQIVRGHERFWVEVTAKSDDGMVTGMVKGAAIGDLQEGLLDPCTFVSLRDWDPYTFIRKPWGIWRQKVPGCARTQDAMH